MLGNVGRIVSDLFTPHTQNKIELGRRAVTPQKNSVQVRAVLKTTYKFVRAGQKTMFVFVVVVLV
mgnify:FL=1